jgi:hypothetical protein
MVLMLMLEAQVGVGAEVTAECILDWRVALGYVFGVDVLERELELVRGLELVLARGVER